MKVTKKQYDLYNEKRSKLLENGTNIIEELETNVNLKMFTENQSHITRKKISDELYFYELQIFRYEILQAFKRFDVAENKLIIHSENSFDELVENDLDKSNVCFKENEKLNRTLKKFAKSNFEAIKILVKSFPKHALDKRHYPIKKSWYDKP